MRTSRPLRGAAVTGTVLTTMVTGLIGGQTLALSSAAETSPTPVESAMPGIPVPELEWTACGGDLECATAAMPRDYDRPNGPTIELALIRRPAIDTENKIGSLFVNAGGPGISGLEFFRTAPPGALDSFPRFDFVSWDPRGIGESSPAVDCTTDAQDDAALDYRFVRPQTLDRKALVAATQEAVDGCVDRNPGILSHLSTANTARDLDVLRAAVGDEKLTYVGISHGTHIGAAYSSLFPDRVRAMVADSPIDLGVWLEGPDGDVAGDDGLARGQPGPLLRRLRSQPARLRIRRLQPGSGVRCSGRTAQPEPSASAELGPPDAGVR